MERADLHTGSANVRERALEVAARTLTAGERVDMQAMAASLGVGRTTLYRWVGDREQVIAEVLVRGGEELWSAALATSTGDPLDRVLIVVGSFLVSSGASGPLRTLVEHEPGVALRVLLDRDGRLGRWLSGRVRELVSGSVPISPAVSEAVDDCVAVCVAMLWSSVAAGVAPDHPRILRVLGSLARPVLG